MPFQATVEQFMSPAPLTIGREQTMTKAHLLMRRHKIRHLPVLEGGKVIGVVTERDLHLLETLPDVKPEQVLVEDAMTPDPYTVSPEARIDEVATVMANNKFGCAVVTSGGKACGVFTTVDALRALAFLVRQQSGMHAA
jgi:acetoin utilization protein AcuB